MSLLRVHVFLVRGPTHDHIEIVVEDLEKKGFLTIDRTCSYFVRWKQPGGKFHYPPYDQDYKDLKERMGCRSVFFDIEADPNQMRQVWKTYCDENYLDFGIFEENCADATQKFLTHFANIPKPSLSHITFNRFFLFFMWPSFIPLSITLPSRTFDNVKYHATGKNFRFASIGKLIELFKLVQPNNEEQKHSDDKVDPAEQDDKELTVDQLPDFYSDYSKQTQRAIVNLINNPLIKEAIKVLINLSSDADESKTKNKSRENKEAINRFNILLGFYHCLHAINQQVEKDTANNPQQQEAMSEDGEQGEQGEQENLISPAQEFVNKLKNEAAAFLKGEQTHDVFTQRCLSHLQEVVPKLNGRPTWKVLLYNLWAALTYPIYYLCSIGLNGAIQKRPTLFDTSIRSKVRKMQAELKTNIPEKAEAIEEKPLPTISACNSSPN